MALEELDSRDRDDDGAWAIPSGEDVRLRVGMHVEHATEDVYLHVADGDLLEAESLEALADALDRGVTVYLEVPSATVADEVGKRVPGAHVAVSNLPFDVGSGDGAPGRLLMVDRETILLSARKDGLVPSEVAETGLWGSEVGHGLVAWLEPLLSARLDHLEFTASER